MKVLIYIEILCLYFYVCSGFQKNTYFNVTDKLSELFELGKKDYENIQKNGETSACWAESINYMIDGCKNLTEHVQMDIALRYSDCFVTSCGLQSHGCALLSDLEKKQCIKSMSSKGYHAYTGFFISVQNICFFLESERWHKRTQININNLLVSSALLTQNLKASSKAKSLLLHSQKETINLQNKFRQKMSVVNKIFAKYELAWNNTVEKYVSVADKHGKLVLTIYDVFSGLNGWALDRYYWLGTVMFYIVSIASMYAFTVQPKVCHARLRIVFILSVNVFLENILYLFFFEKKLIKEADELSGWIWMTRKVALILCVLLIFTSGYNHSENNIFGLKWITNINHRLNALKVIFQKHNQKDVPAAEGVCNIPSISKSRRLPGNTLATRTSMERTPTPRSYDVKTEFAVPPDSNVSSLGHHVRCSASRELTPPTPRSYKVKTEFSVPPGSSLTSLRRYNLRTRNTPPIESPAATAL